MAGLFPSRHPASGRVSWPRGLRRAAFLLAASVALFWSSVAFGRWIIPIPDSEPVYGDLLIALVAVLVRMAEPLGRTARPPGSRAQRGKCPRRMEGVLAHRRRGRRSRRHPAIRVSG